MKLVLAVLMLWSSAFAAISPEEKREALGSTKEVMMKFMAEEGEDVRLINARVADEFGTRLTVEFSIVRDMSETRKCSYSFDRVLKRVIADSWNCDF